MPHSARNARWSAGVVALFLAMPAVGGSEPPAQMSALYPRIGTWNVVIRAPAGPGATKEGVDHGVVHMTKGPGGFSIVQEFSSNGSSGPVVGQSYAWWDVPTKSYRSVWCDSVQGCVTFTTVVAGNAWTVDMDSKADGKKVHTTIRATMTPDYNTIHEEAVTRTDGGSERTESISDYTRVSK